MIAFPDQVVKTGVVGERRSTWTSRGRRCMPVTLGKIGVPTMLSPHTDLFSDGDACNSVLRSATVGALSELPSISSLEISRSHGGCAI